MSDSAPGYPDPPNPAVLDRATIRTALLTSFPDNDPRLIEDYCCQLCAIAEHFDIPFESLRRWIYDRPAGKDFSIASWREWCRKYVDLRSQLPPDAALEPDAPAPQPAAFGEMPASPSKSAAAICTHCFSRLVQVIDLRWWCPVCGEVEPKR